MARSSIMGGDPAPTRTPGTDIDRLGPSDTSDSGSDVQGERPMATMPDNPAEWGAVVAETDTDSDAQGTGERADAAGDTVRENADILPDRVVGPGAGDGRIAPGDVQGLAGEGDGEEVGAGIEGTGPD